MDKAQASAVPSFAVVGHPNKGKSSIVATLAEDDDIAVSPVPGTTRQAREFALMVDGQPLYQLVDTPGFQRAGELLDWLQAQAGDAATRPQTVADFVQQFAADPRFADECELLSPIIAGCGILYVVDGTKPYGPEYEVEMEILRWTGQPRMALINMIGEGDFVAQWREALGQYFSIVRQFDAMYADFDTRIELLNAFAELDDAGKPALQQAVSLLRSERQRRLQLSAAAIAQCLVHGLTATQTTRLGDLQTAKEPQAKLEARLKDELARNEVRTRARIEDLYRHFHLDRDVGGSATAMMDQDLFATETWQVFGLSRQQLLVTGAVSGAVAGSGLDLVLGGASLMLGAGIGAALGGASAWFGAGELAKVRVLGQQLGGRVLEVGPVQDVNFPWVVLGRAWLHHRLIAERNHARRESMALDAQLATHQMDSVPTELRRRLQRSFVAIRKGGNAAEAEPPLAQAIAELLGTTPQETGH
jgi:hypothetical protein